MSVIKKGYEPKTGDTLELEIFKIHRNPTMLTDDLIFVANVFENEKDALEELEILKIENPNDEFILTKWEVIKGGSYR